MSPETPIPHRLSEQSRHNSTPVDESKEIWEDVPASSVTSKRPVRHPFRLTEVEVSLGRVGLGGT